MSMGAQHVANIFVASQVKIVPKLWGSEEWILNEPEYCKKLLHINPGYKSSLHFHPIKKESFIVLEGSCCVELHKTDRVQVYTLHEGSVLTILPGQPHRFWTYCELGCDVEEVSTHHEDSDVIRLEESREM